MVEQKKAVVALIGGGPACSAAAIQLSRSGIEILLISESLGGTIRNANLIENLLGFPEGIKGKEYAQLIEEQLERNNIPLLKEKVLEIKKEGNSFKIITSEQVIFAQYVVVGTGTSPKHLNIKGEKTVYQQGLLFYEVFNLGQNLQDKEILIIGSGDAAYDYSMNLLKEAKSITVLQRSEKTRSLHILQERVKEQMKIRIVQNRDPEEIITDLNKLYLLTNHKGEKEKFSSDYILVAIGRKPNIDFLSSELLSEYLSSSKRFNILFVGDVKNGNFRQVSIAIGDGIRAAMTIVEEIARTGA